MHVVGDILYTKNIILYFRELKVETVSLWYTYVRVCMCCRLFGTKCDKCSQCFSKNDYVMRAKTKIYHVECFRCCACLKRLETGDEFALRQDGLFCRHDHDVLEGGKHCAVTGLPGSENNNNASLTNNNHHLHPNDGSMSGKIMIL